VKKLVICALALGGIAASAQAADLSVDSLKDPLPDSITYKGVTVYGVIDVGGFYSTASEGNSGSGYAVGTQILSNKFAQNPYWGFANNGIQQSIVGLKIEESIGYGLTAIGKLETGFTPLYGEIADACASIVRGSQQVSSITPAGVAHVEYNGDGSRCGQGLNGEVYGGLSSSTYGTLTAGRNNTLLTGGIFSYDPNAASYAFSGIGITASDWFGSTELARWDDSIKYTFQYGPVHAGAMYAGGSQDSTIQDGAWGGNVGATWRGFSVDAFYDNVRGAVALTANNLAPVTANAIPASVFNVENWALMGKYTYEFGGGWKDDAPTSKITFYGGYVHMDLSNPDRPESAYNGSTTIGGYGIATSGALLYASDRILETYWLGAKYETGPWSFTGAYYDFHQDAFNAAVSSYYNSGLTKTTLASQTSVACNGVIGTTGYTLTQSNTNAKAAGKFLGSTAPSNCAGDYRVGSFVVDYAFTKHFDVYAGVTYSDIGGGLGNGYLTSSATSVSTGLRLKF
jgi:predicted porin